MFKKIFFIILFPLFLGLNANVYAADTEVILDSSDGTSAFTVKDSSNKTVFRAGGDGNVGIGTTSPNAKMDVVGDIKVGNSSATCNATTEGSQRYNSTSKKMEFCNGTAWIEFGISGGGSSPSPSGMIAMFASSCPSGWTEFTALRGRFPRGEPTGNTGSLDAGGSDDAIVVTHTHSIDPSSISINSSGTHTHGSYGYHPSTANNKIGSGTSTNGSIFDNTSIQPAGAHTHSVNSGVFTSNSAGSSGTGANIPMYQEVIFCIKS